MSPESETRADIARRRLARLAESFEADLPRDTESVEGSDRAARSPTGRAPSRTGHRAESLVRRLVPAHLRVIGTVGVAALVLLGWYLFAQRPQATEPLAPVGFAASDGPKQSAGSEIVIDVIGKVKRPGIVTLPRGSRVHEAVEAAGGVKGKVDTRALNMARVLDDGEQIIVGAEAPQASSGGSAAGQPGKINLNQATTEQLETLPGVGPVTAQSILAWRDQNGRFASVDDLLDVDGIGEATLAKLRDLVSV